MGTTDLVIDTNIFIEHIRSKDKQTTTLFSIPSNVRMYISAVTLYELLMGAHSPERRNDIALITNGIIVLPFDENVAHQAAIIYQKLKHSSQLIDFRDIFIAATCIVNNIPLVTSNRKHFDRIEGLQLA